MQMRGAKIGIRIPYAYSNNGKTYWTGISGQPVASSQKNGKSDPVYDSVYPRVTKISFTNERDQAESALKLILKLLIL